MPITTHELFTSQATQSGESPAEVKLYVIKDTVAITRDAALTAIKAASPTTVTVDSATLRRRSLRVDPLGYTAWSGIVNYGVVNLSSSPSRETGSTQRSGEIGLASQNVTQGLGKVAWTLPAAGVPWDPLVNGTAHYPASGGVPDFLGAIGVERDSQGQLRARGTSVDVPTYRFTETHYLDAAEADDRYFLDVARLAAKINREPFRGYEAETVRFEGARWADRFAEDGVTVQDVEVSFVFAY
jgi:hypothetical protein